MAGANKPSVTHQTSDALAAVRLPMIAQLSMNAGCAIRLARTGVHRLDALQQNPISLGMCRWRPVQPRIEASLQHAEHARHRDNGECGLVRAHEPEDPDGSVPVSRANQTAAFESMPRSSRSCLFSRRRRKSSSRSGAASATAASPCRPSFWVAFATHARIDWPVGSNSRARSSGSRPERTRSTI